MKVRWPLTAYLVFLLFPLLIMTIAATTTNWTEGPFAQGMTAKWITEAWNVQSPLVLQSLTVASRAVLIDALVGLPLVIGASALSPTFCRFMEQLTRTSLVVPGLAIGLGLVSLYPSIRQDGHLLVAAHVVATLPFFLAPLFPAISQTQLTECDLVASTLGAKHIRRLLSVTLPLLGPAAISGALMAFTFSLGEYNASFFVIPPASKTLPFGLADAFINQRLELAAASALVFLSVVLPCGLLFQLALRRSARWQAAQ
jgi:putative spermidine/putrescine transport system permease protein